MRATGRDNELEQNENGGQRLIPFLTYGVAPFVPPVLLLTLNDQYQAMKGQFNSAYAAMPANIATESPEYLSVGAMYNEMMQSLLILLLSKRLMIYFLATLATAYAGWRASMGITAVRDCVVGGPGDALDCLNREILRGEKFGATATKGLEDGEDDDSKREDQLFATLIDDSPQSSNVGNALALTLPLALSTTLAFSYLLATFSGGERGEQSNALQDMLVSSLAPSLPFLFSLPSVGLCLLFMATELRWALADNGGTKAPSYCEATTAAPILCAGNVLALVYVIGAYTAKIYPTIYSLDLWPLQNGVNIALAATVARGLSPFLFPTTQGNKSIRTVALALIGITLFDGISVFGTVANAAVDPSAEPSMSVMETVARSKLANPSSESSPLGLLWQPGLLEIILGHNSARATEALGLGDVVFPSILVAWGLAADKDTTSAKADDGSPLGDGVDTSIKPGSYSYTIASVLGYMLGSAATEIVGSFRLLGNVSGLPALIFLVPAMLSSVTIAAWSRNEVGEVWGSSGDDSV